MILTKLVMGKAQLPYVYKGVKATWEAYSRQNDELLMSLNFFRCAIIADRWIVVSSGLSEACPAFTDCLHSHCTAGTMASY